MKHRLALLAAAGLAAAAAPGAVPVEIAPPPTLPDYGPVEPLVHQPAVESRGGMLLRDGRPFFWVGCGDGFGANQSTPTGMWLSWLQGCSLLTVNAVYGVSRQSSLAEVRPGGALRFSQEPPLAAISHVREAMRLGFVCDSPFGPAVLGNLAERRPDATAEFLHPMGHYLDLDILAPQGRAIMAARRAPYWGWIAAHTPPWRAYGEFCREPGPSPRDAGTVARFREWARRKFGGDLAAANAIWGTDFAAWDDVLPLHLAPDAHKIHRKAFQRAVAERPILHLDWCAFVRDDWTRAVAQEAHDARAYAPGLPVTIDLRSHRRVNDDDAGPALDPERIDPLVDVMAVHKGIYPRAYPDGGAPFDPATLFHDTAFELFSLEYFRTVSRHPIVNSENIVSSVRPPLSNFDGMRRNDLARMLDRPWKFRLEGSGEDGRAAGWNAPDLDDAGWDDLSVPGCWDEDPRWPDRKGVGWYRIRFFLPAHFAHDFADDSRQFLLVGKGVAQNGEAWVNGRLAGSLSGNSWDRDYRFDIGPLLRFGATNTVVWRVDGTGGSQNGLRFFCHVLPSDGFGTERPIGEKENAAMLWTSLFRGLSGSLDWQWSGADRLHGWKPGLARRLAAVASVALPAIRSRRSRTAILFSHLSARGLPAHELPDHVRQLAPFCALEFAGAAPEVPGEITFRKRIAENPKAWNLVVAPHVEFVEAATWDAIVAYLRAGGTVAATADSFARRFDDWAPLGGPDALRAAAGKAAASRVVVVPGDADFDAWSAALAPLLPPPDLPLADIGGESREPPLFERFLHGNASRKALYLRNWGGCAHEVEVALPADVASWRVRAVEGGPFRWGEPSRQAAGGAGATPPSLRVRVPSQGVAVALLEAPSAKPLPDALFRAGPTREATMKRLASLLAPPAAGDARPLVLVHADSTENKRGGQGLEVWSSLLDRFDAFGLRAEGAPLAEWSSDRIAKARLLFVGELYDTGTRKAVKVPDANGETLEARIERHVREGGSLLVLGHDTGFVNSHARASRCIAAAFGIPWARQIHWLASAPESCGHGDPLQIRVSGDDIAPDHPCTRGVSTVQFYDLMPLSISKAAAREGAVALARLPADAGEAAGLPVAVALEHGKGRVVVIPDTMLFQPFRKDDADNAAFLENILAWLLRVEIDDARRATARKNRFLSVESFRRMEAEEYLTSNEH